MINYIVQVVLFQVVFLAVYDMFLQKETFFKWNRLYLLATPIISFIVPLLKFESFKNAVPEEYIVMLPEVILNPEVIIEQSFNSVATINYLNLFFYIGVGVLLLLFLYKLNRIVQLIIANKTIHKGQYYLVLLKEKQSAFSFFNFIFIAKNLPEKEEQKIIQHELVHSKHYHSLDLLFFEILKIIMWFNPMVYFYQRRVTLLHEYISDEKVVEATDKKSYFNTLLSETFNVKDISFVNQFYKTSLIKKRIAMITKNKSKKLKQLKYLVLVPLLGSMLLYSSCEPNGSVIETSKVSEAKKAPRTMYYERGEEVNKTTSEKETYLDLYMSFSNGPVLLDGELVDYDQLLPEEKLEYDEVLDKTSKITSKIKTEISLFQINGGRRVIVNQYTRPEFKKPNRSDLKGKENVSFAYVDEVPIFNGCSGSQEELKSCFNESLQKYVLENFKDSLAENLGLESGKKKIYISFKILKDGGVEVVGARAPHPDLEQEAKRVVNSLPEMKPGKMFGEPVNVTYMLPISINVE